MYIRRKHYLEEIGSVVGKDIIKVLTGMRRVGKSTLLKQIQAQLLEDGVASDRIISINFELLEFEDIRDYRVLNTYIEDRMVDDDTYYVFLDEIQEVEGFERVVNSLHATGRAELFITGSNSTLLSGELATLLTGRFYSIEVLPLSFAEMYDYIPLPTREEKLRSFIRTGGMPGTLQYEDAPRVRNYLLDMYQSILLRDIVQRHAIRNIDLLKRFMQFIFANCSQLFSAASISKYLKSEGRRFGRETIYQYLGAAKDAFLIHGVPRYDIRGKDVLKTNEKYFVNDLGFRSLFFDNEQDIAQALENIVYLHLRGQRYEIFVGKVGDKEVDFIAQRGSEICYIQVTYLLADPTTIDREFAPLEAIDDNYPKMVISMDPVNRSRGGIIHKHIIDFLLET
jgi:predicted AAA+ superfamily ATPase